MAQMRLEEAFRGQEGNLRRGKHKCDSLMESYWGVCVCVWRCLQIVLDRREKLLLLSFSTVILGSLTSVCHFEVYRSTGCLEMFNKYCGFF